MEWNVVEIHIYEFLALSFLIGCGGDDGGQ